MSEGPSKNDVLYYIPVLLPFSFQIEFLRRFKPLHNGSKSTLLVYHVNLRKLLLLSVLRLPRKSFLTKSDTIFENSQGTWQRISAQTLDHYNVPVMTSSSSISSSN